MTTEKLTDEERAAKWPPTGRLWAKALRIIDGHAADRAALVAQLEDTEKLRANAVHYWVGKTIVAESECAALRAEVADKAETIRAQNIAYDRLESRLAAANALLESCVPVLDAAGYNAADIRAHLAAQPATAPARDETPGEPTWDALGRRWLPRKPARKEGKSDE